MPYRRGSRRSYGRRRRYSRRQRRPNAARAVVRGTFAPRHQYLKLKSAFSLFRASEVEDYKHIVIRIDTPYSPVSAPGYLIDGDIAPLGWNAYANLFQRYVVHGVKVYAKVYYQATGNTVNSSQLPIQWGIQTGTTATMNGPELRAMPISGSGMVSSDRPFTMKRYFNCNRIQGVSVAKHDRYYFDWGTATGGHSFLRIVPQTSPVNNLVVDFTLTWYISAVASNAVAGDPAAAAVLASFTKPFLSGEKVDPDAAAIQDATNTGFTLNPRALEHVGLGGTKRSADE